MKNNKFAKELEKEEFRVSIFGSARIKKNNPTYKQVYTLAKMIASENIDIVTGGGPGLMNAANAGHKAGRKNNNIHSIGLSIILPEEKKANINLDIEENFDHFSERLDRFMLLSNEIGRAHV